MSRTGPVNSAVARWLKQEALAAYDEALAKATRDRRPATEVFDAVQQEPPPQHGTLIPQVYRVKEEWRQEAETIGLSDEEIEESWAWYERNAGQTVPEPLPQTACRVLFRFNSIEDDWRRDARAAGLSKQEIDSSWSWYSINAFGAPPVLAEAEQVVPESMPESVRRVLTYNSLYFGLAVDVFIKDLVDQFEYPDPVQREADDWFFWDAVGHAFTDPPDADARRALDHLARLVRLKPEHTRRLAEANGTTMEAAKRRLVQEAVVLSFGAAKERIRIGQRKVKDDLGWPITLEDVFTREGLQGILRDLAAENPGPTDEIRDTLASSLGGPFRPAHLADRVVYRNWLTREIRKRVDELLGQELDIKEPGRWGGSRRKEIPYHEEEPLDELPKGVLGPATRAFTAQQMRHTSEREDQERAAFRSTDYYATQRRAWEKKDHIEQTLADRIDWERLLDRIRREREAPVLREFIECVRREPELMDDNVAAARQLGWPEHKVRDVKRRLNGYFAQLAAERRWKSQFPNAL